MEKSYFFVVFLTIICLKTRAQNENEMAIDAMRDAIGSVIKGYTVYSYPTNNYGVGTSCRSKWVPQGIMVCDMIESFGLSKVPENADAWKTVNGYSYKGEGGPIIFHDSVNRSYGVGLLLNKVLHALNINVNLEKKKGNGVTLRIDSAVLRYLQFDKYKAYVLSGQNNSLLEGWKAKKLLVVTSDFVLLDYSITINPKDSFGFVLSTKLDSLLAAVPNIFSQNDSLGVKISKNKDGNFVMKSNRPVVFAIYIKKQKSIEKLSEEKNFDNWGDVITDTMLSPGDYGKD